MMRTRILMILLAVVFLEAATAVAASAADNAEQTRFVPVAARRRAAVLEPCLDWELSAAAAQPCYARARDGELRVGNGFLELRLEQKLGGMTLLNKLSGEELALAGRSVFRAEFVAGTLAEATAGKDARWCESAELAGVTVATSGDEDAAAASLTGRWPGTTVTLRIETRRDEAVIRMRPSFTNTGDGETILRELAFAWPETARVSGTDGELRIVAGKMGGCFASVEFPFLHYPGLGYWPGWPIAPGASYQAEPIAFVAFRNHRGEPGEEAQARGLWEASYEYARAISPYRHDMCINFNSWLCGVKWPTREQVELFKSLGGTSYQLASCDNLVGKQERTPKGNLENDEVEARFAALTKLCRDTGVRPGTYTHYYWRDRAVPCFLHPRHRAYEAWCLGLVRRYGLKLFGPDMGNHMNLVMATGCDVADHGHLGSGGQGRMKKPYGAYRQVRHWFDFLDTLRQEGVEELYFFSTPEARSVHNYAKYEYAHITPDPSSAGNVPAVSIDHRYTDRARTYLCRFLVEPTVTTVPHRVRNGIGHSAKGGHPDNCFDIRGWRYSLMSCFTMAPIGRYGVLEGIPEADAAFTKKWVAWTKRYRDHLVRTGPVLLDVPPGPGTQPRLASVGVYGFNHVRGDGRGFLALHNGSFRAQEVDLELRVAAAAGKPVQVRQIYPAAAAAVPGPGGEQGFGQGDHLVLTVPPRCVRLFQVGPPDFFDDALRPAASVDAVVEPQQDLYLGDWKPVATTDGRVGFATAFTLPGPVRRCLADRAHWPAVDAAAPQTDTAPYLVLLLDHRAERSWPEEAPIILETKRGEREWNPDAHRVAVSLNGNGAQPAQAFIDKRSLFYAVRLVDGTGGVKIEGENTVEVSLPDKAGLTFQGAYLEVPDGYRE